MKVISKLAVVIATGVVIVILQLVPTANAQPATNSPAPEPFEFVNVPLDVAIQALAREADVNYLIDPRVIRWWQRSVADGGTDQTPIENFRLTNMTPEEVLDRILADHHLVFLEDPPTRIARVTYPRQTIQPLNADLYGVMTNRASNLLPIQFTDVPLDICLQALAREARINYLLDPQIGYGKPDEHGDIQTAPIVNAIWQNVTPAQGFVALCENYGFNVARDPNSHICFVRTKDNPVTLFTNADFLTGDTNQFASGSNSSAPANNVPLDVFLYGLAKEAKLDVTVDPSVGQLTYIDVSSWFAVMGPKQILVTLCENYDLIITKDSATGQIHIHPRD